MKKLDQISAVGLLVFSALVIYISSGMPLTDADGFAPGQGFFPFWLGIIMAALSVLLYIEGWRRKLEEDQPAPSMSRQAVTIVLATLGLVIAFAFLLERIGFIIDSLIFVFIIVHYIEKESRKHAAIFTVAFTATLFILFQILLGINLPKNMFGF